jgi:histidine triad (HIT) family protein
MYVCEEIFKTRYIKVGSKCNLLTMSKISCIFCCIIAGRSPVAEIYEDPDFLVLMDKYPINLGHTLVIPKRHYDNLLSMPPKHVGGLYSLVTIIAKAVVSAVKADGFNVGQNNGRAANQIVPHVHVHIIPRFNDDSPNGKWPTRHVASYEDLLEIAYKIKGLLNSTLIDDMKFDFTTLSSREEKP